MNNSIKLPEIETSLAIYVHACFGFMVKINSKAKNIILNNNNAKLLINNLTNSLNELNESIKNSQYALEKKYKFDSIEFEFYSDWIKFAEQLAIVFFSIATRIYKVTKNKNDLVGRLFFEKYRIFSNLINTDKEIS